jgi:C4-dicarboxylate-specific signal transduction histidine kinase
VNRLILQVLLAMHPNIRGGDISFILELGPDVPEIVADGIQIQQVLLNLISNAIDSVNASGSSNRTSRPLSGLIFQKRRSWVIVEDTGIGISDPGRIFEAFFTTKVKGMGIGLAIWQSIIAAHGGALVAANRDEGGARFSFSLPR